MSDLAKDLLTRYYGHGVESSGKRFVSIHQCVASVKNDEEKQVTQQISSSPGTEDVSNEESQKDDNEYPELSIVDEDSHRSSPGGIEDISDFDENLETLDIDFGRNVTWDVPESPKSSHVRDESPDIVTETANVLEMKDNDLKDTDDNDANLTFIEDTFPDSCSDTSSTLNKSSETSENVPTMPKREPICNQTFADFCGIELQQFPSKILNQFPYLRMLYVADNNLTEIPDDIFTCLRLLEWLDLRNNQFSSLPASIKSHPCLQTLLLQRNKIEHLPLELCTLPKLKTLQVAQNPLITPPQNIVASGCTAIMDFLRTEWNKAHPEERVESTKNKIKPNMSTILCYESPRRGKKRIASLKCAARNRNLSAVEKRKAYKPSSRCDNKGANISMEYRLLWYAKLKELFAKQTAILQKIKDEDVLKQWRRDKRSFSRSMEKAMKRSEDNIPFGLDMEDDTFGSHRNFKAEKGRSKVKGKQAFIPPTDINKKINELLKSLNELEVQDTAMTTPRTKQNLFNNEIEKILQFQDEIQNLQKYNMATLLRKI